MIDFNSYYMLIALAVREKAHCAGRKVGAIIVKKNRIISAGYNGTPEGMANCEEGGCIRCKKIGIKSRLYDKCICVHAEQNAMITAARFGHSTEGSVAYSTLQPCFTCAKEFLQAKIKTFYYLEDIGVEEDKDFFEQYKILLNRFDVVPEKLPKNKIFVGLAGIEKYLGDA